jgi:uncharacterized protein YggU (UPF0235/DUF167 family)
MKIYIKVIPRSAKNEIHPVKSGEAGSCMTKFNRVNKISEGNYRVKLTASPTNGKANSMLVDILADYFKVPKSSIIILGGKTARTKLIEIQ